MCPPERLPLLCLGESKPEAPALSLEGEENGGAGWRRNPVLWEESGNCLGWTVPRSPQFPGTSAHSQGEESWSPQEDAVSRCLSPLTPLLQPPRTPCSASHAALRGRQTGAGPTPECRARMSAAPEACSDFTRMHASQRFSPLLSPFHSSLYILLFYALPHFSRNSLYF